MKHEHAPVWVRDFFKIYPESDSPKQTIRRLGEVREHLAANNRSGRPISNPEHKVPTTLVSQSNTVAA